MMTIRVVDLADLAELTAEYVRLGITFKASKHGDGYWHVELLGH